MVVLLLHSSTIMNKPEELVIFISELSKDDPYFDTRKLEALMFQIDKKSFFENGKTVTGLEYEKPKKRTITKKSV